VTELLHITDRATWENARRSGAYEMSTRGRTLGDVGFIHCSLPHQLPAVAEVLYADVDPDELVVLVIDADRVEAPVRYEIPEPGAEEFPHVYGPVPLDAIVRIEQWRG
jgi:uncharacterized protein (DUF952 family)